MIRGNSSATTQVGIGTGNPASAAALEMVGTSKGLLINRMTTAQMTAISSPPDGLMVVNTSFRGSLFIKNTQHWLPVRSLMPISNITASQTIDFISTIYNVSAASGNITITLPTLASFGNAGQEIVLVRTDNSANTVTVQRGGTNTILNAGNSFTMAAFERVELVSISNTQWSATVQATK